MSRQDIINKIAQVMKAAFDEEGEIAKANIKASIDIYAGNPPVPSEPGQPPHRRSGELRKSVYAEVEPSGHNELTLIVGASKYYGEYLEFGTEKMEARPFIRPEVRESRKRIKAALAEYLKL